MDSVPASRRQGPPSGVPAGESIPQGALGVACSDAPPRVAVGRVRRAVLLFFASIFFGLGALGAMLPGLPATPFLLLCSYFLVRSSPRLNARLLRSRVFGHILVDWQVHGGVRPDVKIKAIAVVLVAVALSIWLSGSKLWVAIAVILLAGIGIYVILRLPPARDLPKHN